MRLIVAIAHLWEEKKPSDRISPSRSGPLEWFSTVSRMMATMWRICLNFFSFHSLSTPFLALVFFSGFSSASVYFSTFVRCLFWAVEFNMCIEYYKSRILHTRNQQQQKWKKCLNILVVFFCLFVHSLLSSIQNRKLWIIPSLIDYSVCVSLCVFPLLPRFRCVLMLCLWLNLQFVAFNCRLEPTHRPNEEELWRWC